MEEIKPIVKGDRGTGGLTVLCKKCYFPIMYIKKGEIKDKMSRIEEIPLFCKNHR